MNVQRWVAVACAAPLVAALAFVGEAPASASTCPTVNEFGTTSLPPKPGVDWSGCSLKGVNLPANQNLADPNSGANLSGANLSGANLVGATLAFANLTGANLVGTNFGGALLAGANMTGANLTRASLAGANLSGDTRLRNADVTGAVFANKKNGQGDAYVCGKPGRTVLFRTHGTPKNLPKGWKLQGGQILAMQVACDSGAPD